MDNSTLLSRRLFRRKIKVHPQQKCTENIENAEMNTIISNTRSGLVSQKSLLTTLNPGEEIVFPSHQRSLTQNDNTNVLSRDISSNSIMQSDENNIQRQQDVLESNETYAKMEQQDGTKVTFLNLEQKGLKSYIEWFEEIKMMYFIIKIYFSFFDF